MEYTLTEHFNGAAIDIVEVFIRNHGGFFTEGPSFWRNSVMKQVPARAVTFTSNRY